VLAQITTVLGNLGISITSVLQHEPETAADERARSTVPLVVMTHEAPEGAARAAADQLEQLEAVCGPVTRLRVKG
jgi:homoserine dehydrogenase